MKEITHDDLARAASGGYTPDGTDRADRVLALLHKHGHPLRMCERGWGYVSEPCGTCSLKCRRVLAVWLEEED